LLAFILGLSAVLIPLFGTMDMLEKLNSEDPNIRSEVYKFDFDDVCKYK
jgi:hypothetical protein